MAYRPGLTRLFSTVPQAWLNLLTVSKSITQSNEWLGIFESQTSEFPILITQATKEWRLPITNQVTEIPLGAAPTHEVMTMSRLLCASHDSHPLPQIRGILRRVRIIMVAKGAATKKKHFHLYASPIDQLTFDEGRWVWLDN
jgi:hypothetical protein